MWCVEISYFSYITIRSTQDSMQPCPWQKSYLVGIPSVIRKWYAQLHGIDFGLLLIFDKFPAWCICGTPGNGTTIYPWFLTGIGNLLFMKVGHIFFIYNGVLFARWAMPMKAQFWQYIVYDLIKLPWEPVCQVMHTN